MLKIRGLQLALHEPQQYEDDGLVFWTVFSGRMLLDYLKMNELHELIQNSEDDSTDID